MQRCKYILLSLLAPAMLVACSADTSQDTSKSSVNSETTQVAKTTDLKDFIPSSSFDDYEESSEYNAIIISKTINSVMGDQSGIEFFSSDIKEVLDKGFKTGKTVIFRGWYEQAGTTLTGIVVYFTPETFNQDWTTKSILDIDTYKYSDGWQAVSKFGQYLSSNDMAKSTEIEETLFFLSMESK